MKLSDRKWTEHWTYSPSLSFCVLFFRIRFHLFYFLTYSINFFLASMLSVIGDQRERWYLTPTDTDGWKIQYYADNNVSLFQLWMMQVSKQKNIEETHYFITGLKAIHGPLMKWHSHQLADTQWFCRFCCSQNNRAWNTCFRNPQGYLHA